MSSSDQMSTPIKQTRSKSKICTTPNPKTPSLSTQTPDKPSQPPRRSRNSGVALSLKEVKRAALNLRETSKQGPQEGEAREGHKGKSSRRQILMPENPVRKQKSAASAEAKLPEKYELLGEFFDSLDCSLRLSRLKGTRPIFTNVSAQIERLTDRRFTYSHLAQMKSLLPEAIEIKKIMVCDERTSCMKPELVISLNIDSLENDKDLKSESRNVNVRKVFRSRLMYFVKAHPEGDEVPEEELPWPFNFSKQKQQSVSRKAFASQDASIDAATNLPPVATSHLPPSFQRRFSKFSLNNETEEGSHNKSESNIQRSPTPEPLSNENLSIDEASSYTQSSAKPFTEKANNDYLSAQKASVCLTPSKEMELIKSGDPSPSKAVGNRSTPVKIASTPARLMAMTPSIDPPKRSYMSPDDDSKNSPNKLVRRPPRSRSLKFDEAAKSEDELDDILPVDLLQSIRKKERKVKEEQDPAISQAKRRRQMIASLPKLFNVILYLFQSLTRSVMPKEELMTKLVSSPLELTDRSEVEEQLNLLLELVPEWISEKLASSGDVLLRINKASSPESIRAKLEEAE